MCYILHAKPPNLHCPPGPCYMCYMCYMCYILHAMLNHSLRAPCYMCYMCYMGLTRQAAEPPLSPSSLLYVLCAILFCTRKNPRNPGESGCSVGCLVRYSTYSTYSKEPGESGCSVACLVRYSTYSTYSKDAGDCEGSAGWRSVRAAFCMVFAWFLQHVEQLVFCTVLHGFCMTCGTACFLHDMTCGTACFFA